MRTKFSHWRCETHDCSSFNFNNLTRHMMPWCDIKKSERYPSKPRTIGGYHGDVSRKYFADWIDYCKKKELDKIKEISWKRQVEKLNEYLETHEQTNINKYLEGNI